MSIFSAVKAQGTALAASTWIADGDTLKIGSVTYRFKNTPAQINDIYVQATPSAAKSDTALANLVAAINGTGTAGATTFYTGTVTSNEVKAAVGTVAHTMIVTALMPGTAGNSLPFVATSSGLSVDAATLGTTTAGTGSGVADLRSLVTSIRTYYQINADVGRILEQLASELA